MLGLTVVEDEYDHDAWLREVGAVPGPDSTADEPERGRRCLRCFQMRLRRTAQLAAERGIPYIATTLSTSRWKSLTQINEAGASATEGTDITFLPRNWRKGGLQERRNQLVRELEFYNQLYCGCEFSKRNMEAKEQKRTMEEKKQKRTMEAKEQKHDIESKAQK